MYQTQPYQQHFKAIEGLYRAKVAEARMNVDGAAAEAQAMRQAMQELQLAIRALNRHACVYPDADDYHWGTCSVCGACGDV